MLLCDASARGTVSSRGKHRTVLWWFLTSCSLGRLISSMCTDEPYDGTHLVNKFHVSRGYAFPLRERVAELWPY